ncbi:MAG: phosphoenolpyruvate-utilizing N-terminal domain-containing protein, partial [Mycetocola sp.]
MADPIAEPGTGRRAADAATEFDRALTALQAVAADLADRADRARGEAKGVLDAQSMMAQDPALIDDVHSRISTGRTAERAVFEAFNGFQQMLITMGGNLAERAADLGDVSQRTIAQLQGVAAPGVPEVDHPFVLVAHDLAPADTASLDLANVLGLITIGGGPT